MKIRARKHTNKISKEGDVAQNCQGNYLMTQKAGQEGNKPCSCIEYELWGYLTLQPEIQNSRRICDEAVGHKVGKPDFQVKMERTVSSSNVGNILK